MRWNVSLSLLLLLVSSVLTLLVVVAVASFLQNEAENNVCRCGRVPTVLMARDHSFVEDEGGGVVFLVSDEEDDDVFVATMAVFGEAILLCIVYYGG